MIKLIVYVCDGPDCDKEVVSYTRKVPEGWLGIRYTPGILCQPGQVQLAAGSYHFCCSTCLEQRLPPKTVHRDSV
jgi:hypothetical protein